MSKTFWLIVQHANSPKIDVEHTARIDGTKRDAEAAALALRRELGITFIVTVETDKEARLYKTYPRFKAVNE